MARRFTGTLWMVLILAFTGCSDALVSDSPVASERAVLDAPTQGKLRHPQLLDKTAAGKGATQEAHLFLAFDEYEPNGVTRRVLDSYGITRRILEEYGVTRRVLEQHGITRRVLEQYGVTRRVLEAYSLTVSVLAQHGITRRILDDYGQDLTDEWLASFGLTPEFLASQGITRRILDDYGITRRVLHDYSLTHEDFKQLLADFERSIRLKVRIDGARPGIFISLGSLPLSTFLEEIATDTDIAFAELDFPVQGPVIGTVQENLGSELLPWGISWTGANTSALQDARDVHVFVLDSGVYDDDLRIVERKDFTMLFENRDETHWDDSAILEMPFFDPGQEGNPEDETGHGTHLAGTIGASVNGQGMIGMAPDVLIHSYKVMTKLGKTDITTLVAAIDNVIVRKQHNPNMPMVLNLSLGMDIQSTEYNVLDESVRRATEHGIVVVVSAGNDGRDASTYSPAHVSEAITVGSFSESGRFSSFSNTGPSVDILAPGEMIASLSNDPADVAAGYGILESGTSMAAAHVTGAAARLLASNPTATVSNIKNALIGAAKPTILDVPSQTANRSLWIGPHGLEDVTLPPFMQYALASAGVVNLKATSRVESPRGSQTNASVYAGDFLNADASHVDGFAYYVADSGMDYASSFFPRYNPGNLDVGHKIDAIEIPELDMQQMGSQADIRHRGNLTLRGRVRLGTLSDPMVIHVGGNLTADREVTLDGYGIFVVEGTTRLTKAMETAAGGGMAVFYSGGDVIVETANDVVAAHLYSNQGMTISPDVLLRGSLVARANIQVNTGARLEYEPISCSLTEPFWPVGHCNP